MSLQPNSLPKRFCWTRFGTESGEPINGILERKEQERLLQDGMFLWGIGNSVGPAIRELVKREPQPRVVFSPMRSKPKAIDVAPSQILRWTSATTLDGECWPIPDGINVVSRGSSEGGRAKASHYALVCRSDSPLQLDETAGHVIYEDLVNLLSQNKLGHSQVTAVVENHCSGQAKTTKYPAALVVELVFPYFVKLSEPLTKPLSYKGSRRGRHRNQIEQMSLLPC